METSGVTMSVSEHHQVEKEIGSGPSPVLDVGESYPDISTPHMDSYEVPSVITAVTEDPKPELSPELQIGYRLLLSIMSSSKSIVWPFLDPVDTEKYNLWDYHERIKDPMWLRKMESKFENREYNSVTEFVKDFRLMLENCYRYNTIDHWVSKQGMKLERILEQKLNLQSRHIREKTTHFLTSEGRYGEDESNIMSSGLRRRSATRSMFGVDNTEHSPIIAYIKQAEELREIEEKRQREKEKKEEIARVYQESIDWEASLFEEPLGSQFKSMWEIPQVGHFLYICQSALNVGEIPFYELERGFIMPRESSSFAKVITSLLSTPFQRLSLNKKPPMPYGIWAIKLRERVRQWYKVVEQKAGNTKQAAAQLGIDSTFFKVLGQKFRLDKQSFHELTLYQKVWIIKSLIETLVENHQAIKDCINSLPLSELHAITLGHDEGGNTYIHFPHFCGADVRIYRQAPIPDPFARPPREKKKKKEEKEKKKRGRKRKQKEIPAQEEKIHKVKRKRTPKQITPVVRERPSRLRQRIIPVLKPVHQGFDIMDYENTTSTQEEQENSDVCEKNQKLEEQNQSDDTTDLNCKTVEETQQNEDTVPTKCGKHKKRHKKQKKKSKRSKTRHYDETVNSEVEDVGCDDPDRNKDDNDDEEVVEKEEIEANYDSDNDKKVNSSELKKSSKGEGLVKTEKRAGDKNCEEDCKNNIVLSNGSEIKQEVSDESICGSGEDVTNDEDSADIKSERESLIKKEHSANCVKDEGNSMEEECTNEHVSEMDIDNKKIFTGNCKTESDKMKSTDVSETEQVNTKESKDNKSESQPKVNCDQETEEISDIKSDMSLEVTKEPQKKEVKLEAEKEKMEPEVKKEGSVLEDKGEGIESDDKKEEMESGDKKEEMESGDKKEVVASEDKKDGTDSDDKKEGTESDDKKEGTDSDDKKEGIDAEDKKEGIDAEAEVEEEEELLMPEIGPFELVVDGLESLKEFITKFAPEPEPEPEAQSGRGKKKKVDKPPPRKKCVVELYEVLCNLLAELEPWEARIQKAVSRNRMKLKKEWDDFRNQPPPPETMEDVWASEESSSSDEDSSDEDSSEESDDDSSDAEEEQPTASTAKINSDIPGVAIKTDESSSLVQGIINGAIGDGRPTTRRQARLNKEREKRRIRAARAREKKKQEQEQAKTALLSAISTALASGTTTITLPTTSLGTQMSMTSLIALLKSQPGITVSRTTGHAPITTLQSGVASSSQTTQMTFASQAPSIATKAITLQSALSTVTASTMNTTSHTMQVLPVTTASTKQPVTATKVTQVNSGIVMSTLPITNSSFSPPKQVLIKGANTSNVALNAPTVAQQLQFQRMQKQLQQHDEGGHDQSTSSNQNTTTNTAISPPASQHKQQSVLSPIKTVVTDTKTEKTTLLSRDQLLKLLESPQLTSQQKQLIHLQLLQDQLKNQQVTMAQQKLKLQQTSQRVNQQRQQVLAQSQHQTQNTTTNQLQPQNTTTNQLQPQNTTANQQQPGRDQLLQMLPTQQLQLNTQLATTSSLLPSSSGLMANTTIIKSNKVGNIGNVITATPSPTSAASISPITVTTTTPIVSVSTGKAVSDTQQVSTQKVTTLAQSPQYVLIGGKLIPYASLVQQGIRIQGLAQPQQIKQQPKQQLVITQPQQGTKQQQSTNLVYYVKPQTAATATSMQVEQVAKTSSPVVVTQRKTTQPIQSTVTITKEQKQVTSPVQTKSHIQQIKLSPDVHKTVQQVSSPQLQSVVSTPVTTTAAVASGSKVTGMIGNKMVTITGIDPKLLAQSGGKLVLPNNIILTGSKMTQPQKIMLTPQTSTSQSLQKPVAQVSTSLGQIQPTQLLLSPTASQQSVISPPASVTKSTEHTIVLNTSPTKANLLSPNSNTITLPTSVLKSATNTARTVVSLPTGQSLSTGQSVASTIVGSVPVQQVIASTSSAGKSVYILSSTGAGSTHNLVSPGQTNLRVVQVPTAKSTTAIPQIVAVSDASVPTTIGIKPVQSYQTLLSNVKPTVTNRVSSNVVHQQPISSQPSQTVTINPQTVPILTQNQTLTQIKSTGNVAGTSIVPVISAVSVAHSKAQHSTVTTSAPSIVQVVNGSPSKLSVSNKVPSVTFLPASCSVLTQGQKAINTKPLTLTIPNNPGIQSTVVSGNPSIQSSVVTGNPGIQSSVVSGNPGIQSSVVSGNPGVQPKSITIPIPVPIPQSTGVQNLHIVSPQNQAMGNVCVSPVNAVTTSSIHVTSPAVGNQGFVIQNANELASLSASASKLMTSVTGPNPNTKQ